MQLSPIQRQMLIKKFPNLENWISQQETSDKFNSLLGSLAMVKGEKGDAGKDGFTPIKGKDYFTDVEISRIIKFISDAVINSGTIERITPKKGVHYFDGKDGKDGRNGKDGFVDIDEIISKLPKQEVVIETPRTIVEKINSLDSAIEPKAIKGLVTKKEVLDGMALIDGRIKAIDQRWKGGGLSRVTTDSTLTGNGTPASPLHVVSSGGGLSRITITGTVNGTNNLFVATGQLPTWLVIDGAWYEQKDYNNNNVWSAVGLNITSTVYPNSSIWGF